MRQIKLPSVADSKPGVSTRVQRGKVGRRIRNRRLLLNLTQAALAKALGVTYQQIQKYENGTDKLSNERLQKVAQLLSVQPEYFLSDSVETADRLEQFLTEPEAAAVHKAIAGLTDETVRHELIGAILMFCDNQDASANISAGMLGTWMKKMERSVQNASSASRALHDLKVEMGRAIGSAIQSRKFSQTFVAELLGADQARISALARGKIEGISLERLLRYLLLLGWSARVELAERLASKKVHIEMVVHREASF